MTEITPSTEIRDLRPFLDCAMEIGEQMLISGAEVHRVEDSGQLLCLAEILKSCPKAKRISLECKWYDDFDGAVRRARPLMEIFH